ncbi:unnamed protein product [Adineta steineri]|uniref:NHL repeat containing protein n=1 Tax=Adineta steineri TaxID=433720 RepID=A0A814IM49_9BILA|nr:unnamed protein product [Adineta steineri]CAF1045632.1 unnamed protein product [Adineta steineri]
MVRSVLLFILTMNIINMGYTELVDFIFNAAYVSTNSSVIITYNDTCSECICQGLLSSVSPSYVGLNCYNNKTCVLFTNYSSLSSMIQVNLDSTFIFIQQQSSFQNTSAVSFPLNGVTIGGYGNSTGGNANNTLQNPWGLAIGANNTVYVADYGNARVMQFQVGSSTGSIVAGSTTSGSNVNQLKNPAEISVDANSNIYVNDDFNYRVMLWRKNASFGVIAAGNASSGASATQISQSVGLTVDSQGNIYVSDTANHRVMKWTPNATAGILVAGQTGVAGSANNLLNWPYGLYLDENNSYLYIADQRNYRIQRYSLSNSTYGTTVAGGHGAGYASNQLDTPYGMCVSKKTGNIYIADANNHRIQLWSPGATSGVTVVGVTKVSGANATMLNTPSNVALNSDETFLKDESIEDIKPMMLSNLTYHLSQLEEFYFNYSAHFEEDYETDMYLGKRDQLSSSFRIERQ